MIVTKAMYSGEILRFFYKISLTNKSLTIPSGTILYYDSFFLCKISWFDDWILYIKSMNTVSGFEMNIIFMFGLKMLLRKNLTTICNNQQNVIPSYMILHLIDLKNLNPSNYWFYMMKNIRKFTSLNILSQLLKIHVPMCSFKINTFLNSKYIFIAPT